MSNVPDGPIRFVPRPTQALIWLLWFWITAVLAAYLRVLFPYAKLAASLLADLFSGRLL